MHSLLAWLTQYGYVGLAGLLVLGIVGAPVPDETLLVFCGYLSYTGRLHFGWTIFAGLCGSISGISISYFLGLKFGHRVLKPAHLDRAAKLFHRIGPPLLAIGYFIPGVRHFTAVAAGLAGIRFVKFALFAYLGAVLWVSTFVTLGFVFASRWEHTSELVHRYSLIALAVIAVALLAVWLLRRFTTIRKSA
jgi:undecaprenyl-diphosphatase